MSNSSRQNRTPDKDPLSRRVAVSFGQILKPGFSGFGRSDPLNTMQQSYFAAGDTTVGFNPMTWGKPNNAVTRGNLRSALRTVETWKAVLAGAVANVSSLATNRLPADTGQTHVAQLSNKTHHNAIRFATKVSDLELNRASVPNSAAARLPLVTATLGLGQ